MSSRWMLISVLNLLMMKNSKYILSKSDFRKVSLRARCIKNIKEDDNLTFASENGGIMGNILIKVLTYFEKINLVP